ncbi:MAG TPA: hypothetical protein VJB06_01030 [archaeon]|nr:hypothetical protein [archaeon]
MSKGKLAAVVAGVGLAYLAGTTDKEQVAENVRDGRSDRGSAVYLERKEIGRHGSELGKNSREDSGGEGNKTRKKHDKPYVRVKIGDLEEEFELNDTQGNSYDSREKRFSRRTVPDTSQIVYDFSTPNRAAMSRIIMETDFLSHHYEEEPVSEMKTDKINGVTIISVRITHKTGMFRNYVLGFNEGWKPGEEPFIGVVSSALERKSPQEEGNIVSDFAVYASAVSRIDPRNTDVQNLTANIRRAIKADFEKDAEKRYQERRRDLMENARQIYADSVANAKRKGFVHDLSQDKYINILLKEAEDEKRRAAEREVSDQEVFRALSGVKKTLVDRVYDRAWRESIDLAE